MRKYFYFRTEAAVGDDDDIATSVMIPVDAVKAMYPTCLLYTSDAADE